MQNKITFNTKIFPTLLVVSMLHFIWSCSDETNLMISPQKDSVTASYDCSQFNYSDTLFFKSNTANNLIVSTTNNLTGTFGAFPTGLAINKTTGQINITESEAGLRYKVFFIPKNTTDSCFRYITVSGIDFTSGVFNLDNNNLIANPTYKGLSNTLPCSEDDDDDDDEDDDDDDDDDEDDDDDDGCEFDDDEDDDDGDGTADEPEDGEDVTSQGVEINKSTGSINLKNSLKNGALGANPANGTAKVFRIYYRLADNSQKALNFIDIKLHYFKNLSDVPQSLLNTVNEKNKEFGAIIDPNSANFRINRVSKRPPDIIIVGRYNY